MDCNLAIRGDAHQPLALHPFGFIWKDVREILIVAFLAVAYNKRAKAVFPANPRVNPIHHFLFDSLRVSRRSGVVVAHSVLLETSALADTLGSVVP